MDLLYPASAQLEVLTVPAVPANRGIPHDTYNGVDTVFKAIARGGTGTYDYEWDFNGDGTFDFSNTTSDAYDLSARYMYPAQVSNRLFIATIRVTSGAEIVTAEYRVMVHQPLTQYIRVNRAIDDALWFLHTRLNRYSSGGVEYGDYSSQTLGAVGMAVQAFEIQGHKANGNYATNPYVEDVRRGLNYCFYRTYTLPISPQPAGDPDGNGNGIGLYSSLQSQMYETGIVLMALANSGDPSIIADAGLPNPDVAGQTYGQIAQDMVDYLAFGQVENSVWRGGWRYGPTNSNSDMSVTQWPVIGLEAAEENPDFALAITVPGWVKTELGDNFLIYDQGADGGFGYTTPGSNVPRTGAGLACQAWVGLTGPDPENGVAADPAVDAAINYLDNNWGSTGCGGNLGNFYSMYAINKGMRGFAPDIEMIGAHNWYDEYADWLIAGQAADGGWTDSCRFSSRDLATAAGVLILVKEIIQPPPVAVAQASPKEAPPGAMITFDHSGSFHLDPGLDLVAFRWDFNEDGVWDYETNDINAKPTWVYNDDIGCGDEVIHPTILEVEDSGGNTDQDEESVIIKINLFNHPPVAIGDPTPSDPNYTVIPGGVVLLDATSSYDPDTDSPIKCDQAAPDDYIVSWEWDLDNDGIFDVEGETHAFDTPDDWVIGTTHTVQLRVTDDGSWAGPEGGGSKSGETTISILVVEKPPEIPVDIDIKPGSCPNPMRLKCTGVLPAAILGTDELDVSTINPETVMITREGIANGVPLIRHSYEDVGTPFEGELCDCHKLRKDGYMDLTLKFMVAEVVDGLMLDEFADRETIPLTIIGQTYDGTPIQGEDCIWIIGYLKKECRSDLDCDADVDGTDAAMFKQEFGRSNCKKIDPCLADFQSDGDVDGSDIFTFKSEFGISLLW